jgi:hypothetical protein
MSAKSLALLLVSALTIAGAAVGKGVRRYHARPQERCGIPEADYQPRHPPPLVDPVIAVSQVGVLLAQPQTTASDTAMSLKIEGARTTAPRTRVKVYQFAPTSLQIDHCSISRMALFLTDRGHWRLSLQADQNPQVVLPPAGVAVPTTAQVRGLPNVQLKQTTHLKRNLFVIKVRGLGAYREPLAVPPKPPTQGKPVLMDLPPIEFWVQRGVPYSAVFENENGDSATYFDQIDRVEIEFSYR